MSRTISHSQCARSCFNDCSLLRFCHAISCRNLILSFICAHFTLDRVEKLKTHVYDIIIFAFVQVTSNCASYCVVNHCWISFLILSYGEKFKFVMQWFDDKRILCDIYKYKRFQNPASYIVSMTDVEDFNTAKIL